MSKVYVIIGTSSQATADSDEWVVGYKKTQDGANHYAKTCTEIAAELWRSNCNLRADTAAHRLDPKWRQDYCATTYRVEVAELLGRVGAAL